MKTQSGYELYRELRREKSIEIEFGGKRYRLSFFGCPTDVGNGLRATCMSTGETRELRSGFSSESTWNFLTTLESNRWEKPVGNWKDPKDY